METCLEFLITLLFYSIVLTNCSVENFGVRGISKESKRTYSVKIYD